VYISEQETLVPGAYLDVSLEECTGDDEMLDFDGLLLTTELERVYCLFQDTIAMPLALLDGLSFKKTIRYPSSDGHRIDSQLACNLWDSQKRCCIFVHVTMNQGTRTIFPKSARKITAHLWQLQQPSQTTTRRDKHQQTKHGLFEREKDGEGQPETSRAISGLWHYQTGTEGKTRQGTTGRMRGNYSGFSGDYPQVRCCSNRLTDCSSLLLFSVSSQHFYRINSYCQGMLNLNIALRLLSRRLVANYQRFLSSSWIITVGGSPFHREVTLKAEGERVNSCIQKS
jgi:hypothetical protein